MTKLIAVLLLCSLVGYVVGAGVIRLERSIESGHRHNREAEKSICEGRSPCGWALYKKHTRYIDFFMKNSCECPETKECVRDDDDISVSAYVYRCHDQQKKEEPEQKKDEATQRR